MTRCIIDPNFMYSGFTFPYEIMTHMVFPDGELNLKLPSFHGEKVDVIADLSNDAQLTRWFLALSAITERQPELINLIIPFFPYSTMEKAKSEEDVVTARLVAKMIEYALADCPFTISLLEIHDPIITTFFKTEAVFEIDMFPTYIEMVQKFQKSMGISMDQVVFASVDEDENRGKILDKLRTHFQIDPPVAAIHKERMSSTRTRVIKGDVSGRHVLIFDDMLRTGDSACSAAYQYVERAGALSASLIATHNRMYSNCFANLRDEFFKYVAVTNSVPRRVSNWLNVHSIGSAIQAHMVKRRHQEKLHGKV